MQHVLVVMSTASALTAFPLERLVMDAKWVDPDVHEIEVAAWFDMFNGVYKIEYWISQFEDTKIIHITKELHIILRRQLTILHIIIFTYFLLYGKFTFRIKHIHIFINSSLSQDRLMCTQLTGIDVKT